MNKDNNHAVPSIEEIQSIYEDILRNEAIANKEKDLEKSGEFYKRFRKEENKREEEKLENPIINEYRKYLKNEENKQKKLIEEIENQINYEKFFLEIERKRNKKNNSSRFYGSNEATRYRVDMINSYSQKLRDIINSSPDAWQYYYHRQLMHDIQTGYKQDLVEVPYVVAAKKKIIESLRQSTPVYIIGHLGSGKTQIAREAAIEFTIENLIQEELEDGMEKWFLNNQSASEEKAIAKFVKLNKSRRNYYKDLLKEGNQEDLDKIYPYFISGSYNLTYEDMFVEKTLSLENSSQNESNLEWTVNTKLDNFLKKFASIRNRTQISQ